MNAPEILDTGAKRLGLDLPEQALDNLLIFAQELLRWNQKINLVAKAPIEQILESHFLDSLTLLPLLFKHAPSGSLLDIGSGAGFPGLVLAAALPDWQFVLAEPRLKRVSFLKQIIRLLKLTNVEVVAERLTKTGPAALLSQGFPLITSRAFANINDFLDLAEPFCRPGGRIICMKGPKAQAETEEWQRKDARKSFKLSEFQESTLPFSGATRSLLVFTRQG